MEDYSIPENGEIEKGKWYSISEYDGNLIQRGDFVRITFHPYSQKHFYKDDFFEYFPLYFGKVISSNNNVFEDLLIKPRKGKSFYYKNYVGTSGMVDASFYRPKNSQDIPEEPEQHPYQNFVENL